MRRALSSRPALWLSLTLAGCGGGGGGGGGPVLALSDATLSGSYHLVSLSGTGSPATFCGETGPGTADGAGVGTFSLISNVDGAIDGPTTFSAGYRVAANGVLEFPDPADPLLALHSGGVTSDGEMGLVGAVAPGDPPGVTMLLRRGATEGNVTMAGHYHLVRLGTVPGTDDTSVWWGHLRAGGGFVYDGAVLTNTMGVAWSALVLGTYSVATDGAATLTINGETFSGAVAPDGHVAFFGGGSTVGSPPGIVVLVKVAPSATRAHFAGTYWTVSVERERDGVFRTRTGFTRADGEGHLSTTMTSNTEGTIVSDPTYSREYFVLEDGEVHMERGPKGGIGPEGRVVVTGGGTSTNGGPLLQIYCRR
jgi:hypothetical protein